MASKKKSKKQIKKTIKKAAPKKLKKPVKKTAKMAVKKPVKKTTKKTTKKVTQKLTDKVVQKTIKKPATKSTQKPIPKIDYSKTISPLADRLVVRLIADETVTAGGLIIPDTVSSVVGYLKAKVLAIGSGTKNKKGHIKPMDVQIGDTVLFSQYSGTKVEFNSEELQIIKESDVMGILQN